MDSGFMCSVTDIGNTFAGFNLINIVEVCICFLRGSCHNAKLCHYVINMCQISVIFLYCYLSCPTDAIQLGQATWPIW